jgi:crotonobetainyl-CoA:carnitine CoA-transferase CaiB-like acyl-CoA transferase
VALSRHFGDVFVTEPVVSWVARFMSSGVPAGDVRLVHQPFADPQVEANGLVQRVRQERGGAVDLLGALFKIDGVAKPSTRPAPGLGEHTDALLAELDLSAPRTAPDDDDRRLVRGA